MNWIFIHRTTEILVSPRIKSSYTSLKAQDLNYFIEFIMENKSYTIHGYYTVKTWSVKYMFTFNICSI